MHFVELDKKGNVCMAGYAPYLDYRPISEDENKSITTYLDEAWLKEDLESKVVSFAVSTMVPKHLDRVKRNKEELVDKTISAVKDRLTKEINYWDHRANELKAQESAGRVNARINSAKARQRADELEGRLRKRLEELEQEKRLSPLPPVAIGGALIIPAGLIARLKGVTTAEPDITAQEKDRIERIAMETIVEAERRLGFEPYDVSREKLGYDIESKIPGTGCLRFIEVKGRVSGAQTVTITKNEILTAFNKPDDYILAIVKIDGNNSIPRYVRKPFQREPDFGVTSVNYDLGELLARSEEPR
jgi:RNase H-fold protein (predicted Holliday junction resolvase)